MTKKIIAILILLLIIVAGYFYYLKMKMPVVINGGDLRLDTIQDEKSTEKSKETGNVSGATEKNIRVFQPKSGDEISMPVKVLGEARVFENQFVIRIKDKKGNILAEENVTAMDGDMGQFNLFEKEIEYKKPATTEGTMEVFDYSAKDGEEIDKSIIPIKFKYGNKY